MLKDEENKKEVTSNEIADRLDRIIELLESIDSNIIDVEEAAKEIK